jgi:hypothetical protein
VGALKKSYLTDPSVFPLSPVALQVLSSQGLLEK